MKAWKKYLLCLLAMILCLSMQVVKAEEETTDSLPTSAAEGNAYAVLTDEGDLIFFRSTNTYANDTVRTVKDIKNNTYTGTVYTGFETSHYNSTGDSPWYVKRNAIHRVYVASGQTIHPLSTAYWFYKCKDMESFDPKGFDTANTIDMSSMFYHCRSLTSLSLNGFSTGNVTTMSGMFRFCSYLRSVDLSSFNTSKVTDMSYMFAEATGLKTLDLRSFNTVKVTDMTGMFQNCLDLIQLDLSSFNTSTVQSMTGMFDVCMDLGVVKLGSKWTKWTSDARLPEGTWNQRDLDLSKSETQLQSQYPANASAWKGAWVRITYGAIRRIYDESPLKESIEVAKELAQKTNVYQFSSIIVAKDSDFADALSGSYLAARKNCPILLINDSNHEEAHEYIEENLISGGTVYILGSSSAVSSSFEEDLEGYEIKRLEGSSRYMTNLAIVKEAGMTDSRDIFVVTGSGFADSLSSASVGLPILMVDNTKTSLKSSQKNWLQENDINNIYILGETASVNESLEKALKSYGTVTRIGGSSRWVTTRLVAERFFANPTHVILATGNDYVDGLIASPLAYALHSPILMCASNKTFQAMTYVQDHPVSKAYIMGSRDRISDESARKILLIDDSVEITEY